MHPALNEIVKKKIEKTMEHLRRNNMEAVFAETKEEARALLASYLPEGCVIGCGGSVTLDEIDAISLFRSGKYRFLDRYEKGLSQEALKQLFRDSFSADVYVMSANAITEDGVLFNVDGRSNRVAALLYGPDSVVVVAGYNKIVPDLDAAIARVKTEAAPANALRLSCNTPCTKLGSCISMAEGQSQEMCAGCQTPARICCSYAASAYQREKGRVKVILVGEALGF